MSIFEAMMLQCEVDRLEKEVIMWREIANTQTDELAAMKQRVEIAEAALAEAEARFKVMVEQKEFFRNSWEMAEEELAAVRNSLQGFAKQALFNAMSNLSEYHWCAGWMDGTEYFLWDAVEKNQPITWGMRDLQQDDIDQLRALREVSGGWWIWDDEHYETFVSIDRMTELRQCKVAE